MKLRLFLLLFSLAFVCQAPEPVMAQIVTPFDRRMNEGKSQYNKKQYKTALATFKGILRGYPNMKSTVQPWINKCNARLRETEEANRREREAAEQRAREEAARREREAAEQREREEAARREREAAEQRTREEAAERRERERLAALSQPIRQLLANMVRVEGGTFTMGATAEQGGDSVSNEMPVHQVTLSSFCIGKYEVTQAEWQAVMGTNPSNFKGDYLPVENVSWYDCQDSFVN